MSKRKARTPARRIEVSPEQRHHLINDVAYFRTLERHGKGARPDDNAAAWCEVEAEIDEIMKRHHVRDAE